jgi:hypothetical protein
MIKGLIKLANHLDSKGFSKEADALDGVITKIASNWNDDGSWDDRMQPGVDPGPETGIFTAGDDQFDVRRINFEGMDKDTILNILWNAIKLNDLVTDAEIATIEDDWGVISSMEDLALVRSVKNIDSFSKQVKHNYDNDDGELEVSPPWAAEEILLNLELTKVRRDVGEELSI